MDKILDFLSMVWHTYIISDEGLATLLVVFAIVLKLFINHKVTKLHFKKMIISIPSEITFLVIGFLLSAMMINSNDIRAIMAIIVVSLIIIVGQYALERYLDDKLSGKIGFVNWLFIMLTYIASAALYYIVVFGGNY